MCDSLYALEPEINQGSVNTEYFNLIHFGTDDNVISKVFQIQMNISITICLTVTCSSHSENINIYPGSFSGRTSRLVSHHF